MGKYEVVRDQRKAGFQDWQGARDLAARTKSEAINHLDTYLDQFARLLEARGTIIHWAGNAQQARDIILGILREKNAKVIVKSKAMTTEEIHLNEAMENAGCEVVESVRFRRRSNRNCTMPPLTIPRSSRWSHAVCCVRNTCRPMWALPVRILPSPRPG
ncbi:MAG: LUD domain-containing protein [Verrucomicrobia bacterium]|nr:LUD domain-containing protein [Verrucomicrobiota bacterium]